MIAVRGNSKKRRVLNAELVAKQRAAARHIMNAIRKIKSESLQIKRELVMLVQSQSLRTRKSKLVSCIAVCNGEGLKFSSAYGEALVDLVAAGKTKLSIGFMASGVLHEKFK